MMRGGAGLEVKISDIFIYLFAIFPLMDSFVGEKQMLFRITFSSLWFQTVGFSAPGRERGVRAKYRTSLSVDLF